MHQVMNASYYLVQVVVEILGQRQFCKKIIN
jgi:hypothetical protein